MQAVSDQEKLIPDHHELYTEIEMSQDFYSRLKLAGSLQEDDDEEAAAEEEEEEEFSFMCGGEDTSPIKAEDAFTGGQIRPVFPLFNRDLLFSGGGDFDSLNENLPTRPPVKRVFVETNDDKNGKATSSAPENDEIAGPYCEWSSRKAVEGAAAEGCKKSNSTGFSKIWRLKEFVGRCNSDGRDAFVFLNNGHAPPRTAAAASAKAEEKKAETVKVVKKNGKSKRASLSAHEVYLRSKAKEEERRRSYLPYRPELMGFFTTVNGGLTRNVHPY